MIYVFAFNVINVEIIVSPPTQTDKKLFITLLQYYRRGKHKRAFYVLRLRTS